MSNQYPVFVPRHRLRQMMVLLVLAAVIPVTTYLLLPYIPSLRRLSVDASQLPNISPSTLPAKQGVIGPSPLHPPRITNVQVIDFDRDGKLDVIACDARQNCLFWYRQHIDQQWEEHILGKDLPAPANATVVDLDHDGDRDVIVSVLGDIQPNDERVGRVVLLENLGDDFQVRYLLDDIRRVADVQVGDLDGDGDRDLVVAIFGYGHGKILWLENQGQLRFQDHLLLSAAGTIHVPLADYDQDGDLDVAAVVSQDSEQVWAFENLGAGNFSPREIYATVNFDLGSAGLVKSDLDGDGDVDLLLPTGDNLEDMYSYPQSYHGCLWLENQGGWKFETHRIAQFGGTYAAAPGDLDGDGDQDVVLVSMLNGWYQDEAPTIAWLENDGQQNFRTWGFAEGPTHLVTVACGDLNDDGRDDIVCGGLHLWKPFDRMGRITSWISNPGEAP